MHPSLLICARRCEEVAKGVDRREAESGSVDKPKQRPLDAPAAAATDELSRGRGNTGAVEKGQEICER